MKKKFCFLLLLIFITFVGFTGVLLFHTNPQRELETEVKTLSEPLLEIHALLFQAKSADETKRSGLEHQAREKLAALEGTLISSPKTLAQQVVLPKYVLLLGLSGQKDAAAVQLRKGIQEVDSIQNAEIETALYVNWAECALECGDFESYEQGFRKASERMKASSNARWKDDMAKTLDNLRILGEEKSPKA